MYMEKIEFEIPTITSISIDELEEIIVASATRCPIGTTFTCGTTVNWY